MDFGTIAAIAGPIISGMMGSDAAESASNAQSQATAQAAQTQLQAQREAIAEQRRQYNLTRSDLAPWRNAGGGAISRLSDLMGLGGSRVATSPAGASAAPMVDSYGIPNDAPRWTNPANGAGYAYWNGQWTSLAGDPVPVGETGGFPDPSGLPAPAAPASSQPVTTSGPSAYQPNVGSIWIDPATGGKYRFNGSNWTDMGGNVVHEGAGGPWKDVGGVATPEQYTQSPLTRSFTISDFWNDPVVQLGYQSGLDRGIKGINMGAGAAGLRNSGQTLKALTQFGTDYTGSKAGESRGRFMEDQNNIYNKFAGISGTGQNATNTAVNAGAGTAAGIANTITGTAGNLSNLYSSLGNARGAAAIAGGNAFGNAFNTIGNWWQQSKMLDQLKGMNGGGIGSMPVWGGMT